MRPARLALASLMAYEAGVAIWRHRRRTAVYEQAVARANELGRPLVVIGDPDAGLHTRLARAYGCGAVCVDLRGCPACPVSVAADITRTVPQIEDDSAVVFVSCVFEYVGDVEAACREVLRIAGEAENVFLVYVDPWTMTSWVYPGARWRRTARGWRPVRVGERAVLLGAVSLLSVAAAVRS